MAALDEANVEKKFRGVAQTQESIQSLTLWVIHHKAHHEKIVELWFGVLKKSKMSHRLTLFYLCNDIVQTCKRKHAIIYKDAFKDVLKDAVLLVRDNEVRGSIERIFNIWEERSVYDTEFLEELAAILNNTKVRATINSKLLAEFKPQVLMDLITKMKRHDDDVEVKTRQLSTLRLDASNVEAVKLLKDRAQGKEFCQQFEDSCTKLESFVSELDQGLKDRTALIEMLEQSELFYDTQYGEAKIVANAYKNFGTRVNNLRKRLEEHKRLLDNPLSPVPSPSMDAPSPGNTPPHASDILGPVDMDLSDEEGKKAGMPGLGGLAKAKAGDASQSATGLVTADMLFTQMMSDKSGALSFQAPVSESPSPGVTLPWTVPPPPPPPTTSSQSNSANLVQLTEGSGTPVNDEGRCTPVQDEKPDSNMASNPIEFLTQLISQSQKGQGGASTSLFESLSNLSKKIDKAKGNEGNESSATVETPAPGFDNTDSVPPPPAWEPWTTQPETPTPSYVPDTRPTPAMPFGEVTSNAPYASASQAQSHPYTPDVQGHLYTESHPPSEPYTVDSHTAPQPYIMDPKPGGEGFPVDGQAPPPGPPPTYGVDFHQPPPPQPYGTPSSGPPPPPPQFNPDTQYGPPATDQPPPFNTIPPPPPSDPPSSDIPPNTGQYPPPFYQDAAPQAPSPDTPPEGLPGFPPTTTSWGQPFPCDPPVFMPPAVSDSQPHDAPYLPPGVTPPTSIESPANEGTPQFSVSSTSGPPDQPPMFMPPSQGGDRPMFNMPPGQDPPAFSHPPAGSGPQEPPFNAPPGAPGEPPLPFNMNPGIQGEPPPFNMPTGNQEPPPFGGPSANQGDQPPFGGPPHSQGDQPPFGGPPHSQGDQPPFNMPPNSQRDQPPFRGPQSADDQGPYGMPHMNMSGPPRDGPFGMSPGPPDRSPFNMAPSGSQDGPGFDGGPPRGHMERPPFNRQGSGPQDQHMDFGSRGPPTPTHNDGPPLRGILRQPRHNLTTIPTIFDSPSSNSDQDGADGSTIPTMVGKGRPNRPPPPRPPSQPPTPQTPTTPGSGGPLLPSPREEDDQQEFIDKLKRKKTFTPTSPAAPPKGILKNVSQGIRNLRTLTEVPEESGGEKVWTSATDSGSEAKEGDSKGASEEETAEGGSMDMDIDPEHQAPSLEEQRREALFHHQRQSSGDFVERRRSLESPRRVDNAFDPYGDRRGRPPFPRYPPRRPPPAFERFRDNFRPFPKRLPPPPFDYRYRQFPRY